MTLASIAPTLAATAAIRAMNLTRLLNVAARRVRGTTISGAEMADQIAAVQRVARYTPGATCLAESLALTWMLRGKGIAAVVRIGVTAADALTAHAWVEVDGVALTDSRGAAALPVRIQNSEYRIQKTEDGGSEDPPYVRRP